MLRKLCMAGTVLGGLALCALVGQAQQSQPQKPITPANSEDHRSEAQQAAEATLATQEPKVIPDSRPLAGAQDLTLGTIAFHRTYLVPSFTVGTQVGNAHYSGQSGGAAVQTILTGRIDLNRKTGRSELLLGYVAGGTLSKNQFYGNSAIQGLTVSDTIQWGRWNLLLGDQFNYLSQSPFGFGGGMGFLGAGFGNILGGAVGSAPSFRPDLLPNQTILLDRAPRISNTVMVQADYQLSRRSSVTFLGSHGNLKFIDAGFQNDSNTLFQTGYNYAINRKDSISVVYRFDVFNFSNVSQSIRNQNVQLMYARRLAGRLSFQVGVGPDISTFHSPLRGSGTTLNWTATSTLNYQFRKTTAAFSFHRGLTGGSGVLAGAETDQFQGSLGRHLTRNWDASLSLGFSRNQRLRQTSLATDTASPDARFITTHLGRSIGRGGSLFFDYTASKQSTLFLNPAVSAHGVPSLLHTLSVGYTWGLRPIVIE
ncbi:MAG TPA: hypothetical protein VOA41_00105 [Candidatus Dormibacteraeota bacterium]|nr:hypothetical protein [Candidatus Dormibacteraeota bacterium]